MALHHVCLPNAPCQLLRFGAQEPRALNQPTGAASIAGQPDPGPTQETEYQAGSEQGKVVGFVRFGILNHLGLRLVGSFCSFMVSSIALWDPKCVALSGLVSGGTGAVDGMDEALTGGHFLGDARTYFGSFRLPVWA